MRAWVGSAITVTSTERWLSELRKGNAFGGTTYTSGIGGSYTFIQVKNPAASGRQALLRYVNLAVSAGASVSVGFYDTDLGTDIGAVANLLTGGAAGVCHIRTTTQAGMIGTYFWNYTLPGNTNLALERDWIVEISPGKGLIFGVQTLAIGLYASVALLEQ